MTTQTTAPSDVAIITVSYNSSAQLSDFLASAVKSVASPSQITVVDNNSDDIILTEKLAAKMGVNLLKLNENVGYGSAVNKAVSILPRHITTLLVCNPDSELNPKVVAVLSQTVSEPDVGVAGPRIFNLDGSVYPSARNIPSIRNGVGHAMFSKAWPANPWTKKYLSEAHLQDSRLNTGWVSGACLAIRRELFEKIGGFDEHYFMYFEDVDLGFRLGKLGFTNIYIPEVWITHTGGVSTSKNKKKMEIVHHESAMRFLDSKYSQKYMKPTVILMKLGLYIRGIYRSR